VGRKWNIHCREVDGGCIWNVRFAAAQKRFRQRIELEKFVNCLDESPFKLSDFSLKFNVKSSFYQNGPRKDQKEFDVFDFEEFIIF
jgi:hypothetical protein